MEEENKSIGWIYVPFSSIEVEESGMVRWVRGPVQDYVFSADITVPPVCSPPGRSGYVGH